MVKAVNKNYFTRRDRFLFRYRDNIRIRTKSYFKDGRCKQRSLDFRAISTLVDVYSYNHSQNI